MFPTSVSSAGHDLQDLRATLTICGIFVPLPSFTKHIFHHYVGPLWNRFEFGYSFRFYVQSRKTLNM